MRLRWRFKIVAVAVYSRETIERKIDVEFCLKRDVQPSFGMQSEMALPGNRMRDERR